MKLSKHFSLSEAVVTSHEEIKNVPDKATLEIILYAAQQMEILRGILGNNPILISSWYRCALLNKVVGGVPTSEHVQGNAVDFTCPAFGTPYDICRALQAKKEKLLFNQLINERRGNSAWVHISFAIPPSLPKLEALTFDGKKYRPGIIFLA